MPVEKLIGLDERMGRVRPWARVLVVVCAVAMVTLLRWLFSDWLALLPFLPYFPVVVVCAALFDARYGYLASVLVFPVAVYLFVQTPLSFDISREAWIACVLFLLVLLFIAWIVGALKHFALRLHQAERAQAALVREMNHRIKNNLQMVSSLLMLESARFTDPATKLVLDEAVGRVVVIGQLHALLYQGEETGAVRADDFLGRLCDGLRQSMIGPRRIRLEARLYPLLLPVDQAIPLGLIANEAVTNALRHGFPPGCGGTVWVDLAVAHGQAVLSVSDDGGGMGPDPPKGLGTRIITMMASRLSGAVETLRRAGGGTVVRAVFPVG